MSTKVIRRNFDINSTGNLNATSADVLNDIDSQAQTFMEDPRSKLNSGRILINQMSSPGCYNENLNSEQNQPLNSRRNPFTFDTQEGENSYLNQKIIKIIDEDAGFSSEEAEDTLVGHGVSQFYYILLQAIQSRAMLKDQINEYQRKLHKLMM